MNLPAFAARTQAILFSPYHDQIHHKYAKNDASIINYRPSQPSLNNRLPRLWWQLSVAVLPH
jgi:hypothetical protein